MSKIIDDFNEYFCEIDGRGPSGTRAGFLVELSEWLAQNDSACLVTQDYPSAYDGWKLLDELSALPNCMELDSLLELVWDIFAFEMGKTEWHPWVGTLNPLQNEPFDSSYARLFRKGFLVYECLGGAYLEPFSYACGFWPTPQALIDEVATYLSENSINKFCTSAHTVLCRHEDLLNVGHVLDDQVILNSIEKRLVQLLNAKEGDCFERFLAAP